MEEMEFFDPYEKNRKWILLALILLLSAAVLVFYENMPTTIPLAHGHYISSGLVVLAAMGLGVVAGLVFAVRALFKDYMIFPVYLATWWLTVALMVLSLVSLGVMTLQSFRLPDYETYLQTMHQEEDDAVPEFVEEEAYLIAQSLSKEDFLMGIVSDNHVGVTMEDKATLQSAKVASYGLQAIHARQPLDMMAMLGDYTYAGGTYEKDTVLQDITLVQEVFRPVTALLPTLYLQGNHDTNYYAYAKDPLKYQKLTQQEAFENLGAHNTIGTVDPQNPYGNYGFADFEEHKIRVIWLNTCDSEKYEIGISEAQLRWLTQEALDVTYKADGDQWSILVLSHHPLDWNYRTIFVVEILEDYQVGKADKMPYTHDDTKGEYHYDFSHMEKRATVVANIHGHVHNFTSGYIGDKNWLLRVSVPNTSVERNNQYDNEFAERGEDGEKIYWDKKPDTKDATSFCVVALDTQRHSLNLRCFGAGYDREYTYRPYQR